MVGPVEGDERLAKVAQGRLVALPYVRLVQHHPRSLPVLQLAEGIDAPRVTADAPRRLFGHLDLGNQVAEGRVPSRKVDTGSLADQAATAVASDEILVDVERNRGSLSPCRCVRASSRRVQRPGSVSECAALGP